MFWAKRGVTNKTGGFGSFAACQALRRLLGARDKQFPRMIDDEMEVPWKSRDPLMGA